MADLAPESEDDNKSLAAVKYMTLLVEKRATKPSWHSRIDESLIKKVDNNNDSAARPRLWLYEYGFRLGQENPVIVELMPYWLRQPDMDSEDFLPAIKAMFRRVRELITVLKFNAKPAAFRTLDCLGAFHSRKGEGFGMVYAYPWEDTTPIKLNKLLGHDNKCRWFRDSTRDWTSQKFGGASPKLPYLKMGPREYLVIQCAFLLQIAKRLVKSEFARALYGWLRPQSERWRRRIHSGYKAQRLPRISASRLSTGGYHWLQEIV